MQIVFLDSFATPSYLTWEFKASEIWKIRKAQKLFTCNHSDGCPPTGCSGGFLQCSQPLHWPDHLMDWNMFKKVKVKRKLVWETLIQRRILRDLLVLQSSSLCPHTGRCSLLWWKGLQTSINFTSNAKCLLVSFKQWICLVPVLSQGCLVLIISCFRITLLQLAVTKQDLPKVPS